MNEVREQFRAVDDARARSRKVGTGIDREDAPAPDCGEIEPAGKVGELVGLSKHRLQMKSARHDDKDIGSVVTNVTPGNAAGIRAGAAKRILAPCNTHHLRHPLTAAVDAIQPLHTEDSGPPSDRTRLLRRGT